MSSSEEVVNRYWIPGYEIHKKVIIGEIQYYLGPQAGVRPYTQEGQDGYLITTTGPCLSDEQINDICIKSREMWERQAAARNSNSGNNDDDDSKLKRPLHKPIVITKRGQPRNSQHRRRSHHDQGGSSSGSGRRY